MCHSDFMINKSEPQVQAVIRASDSLSSRDDITLWRQSLAGLSQAVSIYLSFYSILQFIVAAHDNSSELSVQFWWLADERWKDLHVALQTVDFL